MANAATAPLPESRVAASGGLRPESDHLGPWGLSPRNREHLEPGRRSVTGWNPDQSRYGHGGGREEPELVPAGAAHASMGG